ncbi:hypothetical protein SAMN05421858_0074 [Haladaptatus litoreus]|uniref:Zinc-ribbon domain-containing protein n=1 Tax=Haladaptatus litoreus TaxID=553468 RepID=A0A1N6US48_9EURY|nr:zinc ribbon domain-containing protein [Haladaptatus litoreus]SIQ68444.1 hypothetical protein SAMN05421858_0074 [Haladaptatus litoreus]
MNCPNCGVDVASDSIYCRDCYRRLSDTVATRPRGITLVCGLVLVSGFLQAVLGYWLLDGGLFATVLGGFALFVAALQFIIVYGLWRFHSWGWKLAVTVYGLDMFFSVGGFSLGDPIGVIKLVLNGVFSSISSRKNIGFESRC